jgi:hypothetical protein
MAKPEVAMAGTVANLAEKKGHTLDSTGSTALF